MPKKKVEEPIEDEDNIKEKLFELYSKEREMDANEFLEYVRTHPSPEKVLEEHICGEVIDLSDYEHFQVVKASPFDFDTLTAYNTAYIYKEAVKYSPVQKIKNYAWMIYLPAILIAMFVGLYLLLSWKGGV